MQFIIMPPIAIKLILQVKGSATEMTSIGVFLPISTISPLIEYASN